jgi:hypothetical protein
VQKGNSGKLAGSNGKSALRFIDFANRRGITLSGLALSSIFCC